MRLKKLSHDSEKYNAYEAEQKIVLSSIISRLNRIGDFFDVVIKLEKFMVEELRTEYTKLINIRQRKQTIEASEGSEAYIKNYFLPAVSELNDKIEISIQNWNRVEKEHTTGKIYGFISAMKNFYKELDNIDKTDLSEEDANLHSSSMTDIIKEIMDSFSKFRMYKAIMCDDLIIRLETLLSMQKDIAEYNEKPNEVKRLTLDDL